MSLMRYAFKDIARRTASDKILRDKAFNIAKNSKYVGYRRGIASMVYTFFDKKSKGNGVNIEVKHNEQLAKELHKPITRHLRKEQFVLDLEVIFGVLI